MQLPAVVPSPPKCRHSAFGISALGGIRRLGPVSRRDQNTHTPSSPLAPEADPGLNTMSRTSPLRPATITHAGTVTSQSQASPRSCVSHVAAARPPSAWGSSPVASLLWRGHIPYLAASQLIKALRQSLAVDAPPAVSRACCQACRSGQVETDPSAPPLLFPNWARHLTRLNRECRSRAGAVAISFRVLHRTCCTSRHIPCT